MKSSADIELTIQSVLASRSASTWLQSCLASALKRDPVDAARDAEEMAILLGELAAAKLKDAQARAEYLESRTKRGAGSGMFSALVNSHG